MAVAAGLNPVMCSRLSITMTASRMKSIEATRLLTRLSASVSVAKRMAQRPKAPAISMKPRVKAQMAISNGSSRGPLVILRSPAMTELTPSMPSVSSTISRVAKCHPSLGRSLGRPIVRPLTVVAEEATNLVILLFLILRIVGLVGDLEGLTQGLQLLGELLLAGSHLQDLLVD